MRRRLFGSPKQPKFKLFDLVNVGHDDFIVTETSLETGGGGTSESIEDSFDNQN
jgi:hypothetical protein